MTLKAFPILGFFDVLEIPRDSQWQVMRSCSLHLAPVGIAEAH